MPKTITRANSSFVSYQINFCKLCPNSTNLFKCKRCTKPSDCGLAITNTKHLPRFDSWKHKPAVSIRQENIPQVCLLPAPRIFPVSVGARVALEATGTLSEALASHSHILSGTFAIRSIPALLSFISC